MIETIQPMVMDAGFYGIIIYLLWERGKFNETIVKTLEEISSVLRERMPDLNKGGI